MKIERRQGKRIMVNQSVSKYVSSQSVTYWHLLSSPLYFCLKERKIGLQIPDIFHFIYTTSGCDSCDKNQVWVYNLLERAKSKKEPLAPSWEWIAFQKQIYLICPMSALRSFCFMDCDDILSFIFISVSRSRERNIFDLAILWGGDKGRNENCGSSQEESSQAWRFVPIFQTFQLFQTIRSKWTDI